MEKKEVEQFLIKKFSVTGAVPHLSLINEARQKVMLRKKAIPSHDVFSILEAFLNFRIRLYHAIALSALLFAGFLYFNMKKNNKQHPVHRGEYVSNIAAVHNSTVLSSINTFILRK